MASDAQNTVFISYRRSTSQHLARLIFNDLRQYGYDVFLDVHTIDSGAFDTIILNQIHARAHFIVLLSPGALERCANEGDWLRREIEQAIRLKRNIVPIIEEGFDFKKETGYLPEEWRDEFVRYNALPLSHFYFDEAMEKLRSRFLKQPVYEVEIKPTPADERTEVRRRIEKAARLETAPEQPADQPRRTFRLVMAALIVAVLVIIGALIVSKILPPPSTSTPTEIGQGPTPTKPPTDTPTPTPTITPTPTNTPIPPTPIPLDHLLISEDFDDGVISGWTNEPAMWEIAYVDSNAVYQRTDSGYASVEMGAAGWQDYAVEFDIRTENIADGGRVFIYTNDSAHDRVSVAIDFGANTLQVYEVSDDSVTELRSINYIFQEKTWVTIRIEVEGLVVRVYLDDKLQKSSHLNSPLQGGVRFRSPNASILFDNVRIWTLKGVFVPTPTPTNTPTPTPIPIDQRLIWENFDNGVISQWPDDPAKWEIAYVDSNAVYRRTGTGNAEFDIGEADWQDYAVEFDIRTENIADGGRVFVYTHDSTQDKVTLAIDFWDNTLQLYEITNGFSAELVDPIQYTFQQKEWVQIRIQVKSQIVRVYLDGKQRMNSRLNSTIKGGVRFKSPNASILFDNIHIWTLDTDS